MDIIDKKILKILSCNSRTPTSTIAKKINKSKETTNYRINKMIKDKTILSFYTNINGSKLGFSYYKILLKYKTINQTTEKSLLQFLKKNEHMIWIGNCDGEYQLMISLLTRNIKELNEFLNSLIEEFGDYLQEKEIMQISSFNLLNENHLEVDTMRILQKQINLEYEKEKISETDMKILRILSNDARIKLVDISKKVDLTAEAISYKIKNLVKKEIIAEFKARINYTKLGYLYYQILLTLNNSETKKRILSEFKKHKNCVTTIEFIGKYDLQLEIIVKNPGELREILNNLRARHGERIQKHTSLTIYKEYGAAVFPV